MFRTALCICLLATSAAAVAADRAERGNASHTQAAANPPKDKAAPAGDMLMSGLSILGNEETPKELVIVPWKSSQLADAPGISRLLDDSTQPVDKDVFMRELAYYGLRTAKPDGN